MPPLLAAAIAAAIPTATATAFTVGATAVTYASIAAYTIFTAGSIALSLALNRPKKEKAAPGSITTSQPVPPRIRGYGRAKLGGAYVFRETSAGNLYNAIVHCEGPIDAIEEWWFNDKKAAIPPGAAGGPAGVDPWFGAVTVTSYLGAPDQAAGIISSLFSTWTPQHRLRGLAYSVVKHGWVRERFFQKVYPNGAPNLRIVARLALVYDPRTASIAWSDNAALAIRDFLTVEREDQETGRVWRFVPASMIDDASFAAFANVCDELVPLKAGGTEKRYRLWGTYEMTERPSEVLPRLLAACDAELYDTAAGKVGIRGGTWAEPMVTLGPESFVDFGYEQASGRRATFNRLKVSYTSPLHDYQPTEGDPWDDLANQEETGELLVQDLDLPMVPSHGQARRLAKIATAKGNPRHKLSLRCNVRALDALGERVVRVQLPELELDTTFLVTRFEIAGDLTGCTLELISLDASAYAWNAAAEEGTAPPVPPDTSVSAVPPQPTGLTLTQVSREISGSIYSAAVRATVNPLTGDAAVYTTVARIRKQGAGDSAWVMMTSDGDWAAVSGTLDDATTYEVQAAHAGWGGADGNVGPYTASQLITVRADQTPTATVASLTATVAGASVGLAWTNPPSANLYGVTLYRSATANIADAQAIATLYYSPGTSGSYTDQGVYPGTWRYFVRPFNRSKLEASPTGSNTVIVTTGNFVERSDDAALWTKDFVSDVTVGAAVADPLGGNKGRVLTFPTAAAGFLYVPAVPTGNVAGRTFTDSLWLRKPTGGKAQIALRLSTNTDANLQIVTLSSTWTRVSLTLTPATADTKLWLILDNRSGFFPPLDGAAGSIEVFGAQIEQAASVGAYQSRP